MKKIVVVVFISMVGTSLYLAYAISDFLPDPRLGFTGSNGFFLTTNHVTTGRGYRLEGDDFILETASTTALETAVTGKKSDHKKSFTLHEGKQILLRDESVGATRWSRTFYYQDLKRKAYTYRWRGQRMKCTDYPFKYFLVSCNNSRIVIWDTDDPPQINLTITKRRILKHPDRVLDNNNQNNIYRKEKRMAEGQRFMQQVDKILAAHLPNRRDIYYPLEPVKFMGGEHRNREDDLREFQKAIYQYDQSRRDNWFFWFMPEQPWDVEREADRKLLEAWHAKSEKE